MKKYSQNDEDEIIHQYFNMGKITVLSIGENDGKTLSNVLRSIEEGASALLVEPSLKAFYRMQELHRDNARVHMLNVAIGTEDTTLDFFESGEHLGTGDVSLLSTLKEGEVERWKSSGETFDRTKTEVITFSSLMELSPFKTFDLISIDAEGFDWEILQQMDLKSLGCKVLVIEVNNDQDLYLKVYKYVYECGLIEHSTNHENSIFIHPDYRCWADKPGIVDIKTLPMPNP